jgi:hypothetical protein
MKSTEVYLSTDSSKWGCGVVSKLILGKKEKKN